MTLEDVRDHMRRQVAAFEAYFATDDQDAKTAKSYRKSVQEAQDRLDVIEKILVDGYAPDSHSSSAPKETTEI